MYSSTQYSSTPYSSTPQGTTLAAKPGEAGEVRPAWAIPAPADNAPRRTGALGGRARAALLRKRRRSLITIGGAVVVIIGIVATMFLLRGKPQSAVLPSDLVTTFQRGELQQVPDACKVEPSAALQQYLPGKLTVSASLPVNGNLRSGCNWTLDQLPTYRLLELDLHAYPPSGMASGNGSATNAATDAYQLAVLAVTNPGKNSPTAKAAVTRLSGLGDEAFSTVQLAKAGGATLDVATVVIRYHNVIVTVKFNGMVAHTAKGVYGPVDKAQLSAAAMAFAQAAAAALH